MRWRWRLRLRAGEGFRDYCVRCCTGARRQRLLCLGGTAGNIFSLPPHADAIPLAPTVQPSELLLPMLMASAAVTDGETVYVAGGYNPDPEYTTDGLYAISDIGSPTGSAITMLDPLPRPLCFAAADLDARGRLWLAGGGDSPYRHARVFDEVLLFDAASGEAASVVGRLQAARCGAALAADCRTSVLYSVGGYGGGAVHRDTVETLTPTLTITITITITITLTLTLTNHHKVCSTSALWRPSTRRRVRQ